MPAGDEPSHPMRPCASLSLKSLLGIAKRISKGKHYKTPAGEGIGSPSAGFPLICDSIPWRVFVPASSFGKVRWAGHPGCCQPVLLIFHAFGPLQTGKDTAQYNIPKESITKRPRGGSHFLFRGRWFIFCFAGYPFCGLFLCCGAGTGIFIPVSAASAFAFSDGIPSFGLLSAPSEGPMNRRGLFLFSAFPLSLLCFSALPLFAFRFSPICQRLRGSGDNGGEWQGMGCGKRGALPLPFSRSQTVPHKLRYPSALCAAYLSISV